MYPTRAAHLSAGDEHVAARAPRRAGSPAGCRKVAADDTSAIAKTVRMPMVRITLSCSPIVLQTLHRSRGSCVLMRTRRTEHGDAAEGVVPVRWCTTNRRAPSSFRAPYLSFSDLHLGVAKTGGHEQLRVYLHLVIKGRSI